MQVNLLLEHDELFVHLNLQVVAGSLDLCLHLDHLFFLLNEQGLALVLRVFLFEGLDSLSLLHFERLELLPVVHRLINSLVHGDKLLVVLHDFEFGVGLDLTRLNCSIELAIERFHLLFMVDL